MKRKSKMGGKRTGEGGVVDNGRRKEEERVVEKEEKEEKEEDEEGRRRRRRKKVECNLDGNRRIIRAGARPHVVSMRSLLNHFFFQIYMSVLITIFLFVQWGPRGPRDARQRGIVELEESRQNAPEPSTLPSFYYNSKK